MTELPARRLMLVHAHPDDESINNGATMARYAAEGTHVTLVTCTLGERGEVIPPELRHLSGAALGGHRLGELREAMAALGVTDFRLLGGAGRYSDSGMMGLPDNNDPGCFWQADVDQAAGLLAEVILEVRPQVLVTYDDNGGYGHPDHIQAHRVAMRGVELAAERGWDVPKVYWNRVPRSVAEEAFARLERDLPDLPFDKSASVGTSPAWSTTSGSPPPSTAPRTPARRPPRCAPTSPRSPSPTSRTSCCPTSSRSRCSPPSTTSWCAADAPAGREDDLFAGVGAGEAS